MRFRCCIDLHSGVVKQIVGSTLKDNNAGEEAPVTNFESELSAGHYATMYKKDELVGGHVIMLGKGNEEAALDALRSYPGGLQVGGGINPENALKYLEAGASHVIVTSYVFRDGGLDQERLDAMVKTVGKERLVLDLSCRSKEGKYYVVTDRWQKFTDLEVPYSPNLRRRAGNGGAFIFPLEHSGAMTLIVLTPNPRLTRRLWTCSQATAASSSSMEWMSRVCNVASWRSWWSSWVSIAPSRSRMQVVHQL